MPVTCARPTPLTTKIADGICGDVDNCPLTPNSNQLDADNDNAGDVCDSCPNDANDDVDGDGICGDIDNCPTIANHGQDDDDSDGVGDVCDVEFCVQIPPGSLMTYSATGSVSSFVQIPAGLEADLATLGVTVGAPDFANL